MSAPGTSARASDLPQGADADVIVVGLGPGGRSAALTLAAHGLEVVAVDEHLVGGECPFYGCTPSKMMVRAAELLAAGRRIRELAGSSSQHPAWGQVARRITEEATHGWEDSREVAELTQAGVKFVRGHARLDGPRTVVVDGSTFTARRGVILGTGTSPGAPPIDGLTDTPYWTNRDVVKVAALPKSVAIIGGGAIGAELCQVMARFGVEVTLLEAEPSLLSGDEPEAGALVEEAFTCEGIEVMTNASIDRIDRIDGRFAVCVDGHVVEAEQLVVAAGRVSNLADAGLDTVGFDIGVQKLKTDERMRVCDGLWAVGDITGRGAYTHIAHYQADIATADILCPGEGPTADYRAVPHVTFTDPEVGAVGMTEAQARAGGIGLRVGFADMAKSPRGWIHGPGNRGFVKVIEDVDRHVLIGATVAGPMAGELLAHLTLAVHAEVSTDVLKSMIYAFPTLQETVEAAVDALD